MNILGINAYHGDSSSCLVQDGKLIAAAEVKNVSEMHFMNFLGESKKNEFFGFFAFSGKATAFVGPLLLGVLTVVFESQRVGISVIFLFFLLGYILLHNVDEVEGMNQGSYTE